MSSLPILTFIFSPLLSFILFFSPTQVHSFWASQTLKKKDTYYPGKQSPQSHLGESSLLRYHWALLRQSENKGFWHSTTATCHYTRPQGEGQFSSMREHNLAPVSRLLLRPVCSMLRAESPRRMGGDTRERGGGSHEALALPVPLCQGTCWDPVVQPDGNCQARGTGILWGESLLIQDTEFTWKMLMKPYNLLEVRSSGPMWKPGNSVHSSPSQTLLTGALAACREGGRASCGLYPAFLPLAGSSRLPVLPLRFCCGWIPFSVCED